MFSIVRMDLGSQGLPSSDIWGGCIYLYTSVYKSNYTQADSI